MLQLDWASSVLKKLKDLPFVDDVIILPSLPEDVEADLGVRLKLSQNANVSYAVKEISKLIAQETWREFEETGNMPTLYWETD